MTTFKATTSTSNQLNYKNMKGKFTSNNWKKIGKGLLIAMAGAGLTYITDTLPNVELGVFQPLVMAGWSVVVNAVRKFLQNE